MNCLLLTSTSQCTLEFHLVALSGYIPVLGCSHISNTMLQWTHGSCTDCTLFLATLLWQPWISEVLWWAGNQPPRGMLLAEMFCCCDMMIPFFLILAESALKATLDQTISSQKPSSWAQRTLLHSLRSQWPAGMAPSLSCNSVSSSFAGSCLIFLRMLCELLIKLSKLFLYREATCLA